MAIHKISEERKNNAKASILNAAFRLRTKEGKIVTVGRKGRKEKLLVLTKWLNEDGSLKEEYAKAFKKLQKGGSFWKFDINKIIFSGQMLPNMPQTFLVQSFGCL